MNKENDLAQNESEMSIKSHQDRSNPNCKYKTLDDKFFKQIDSREKAYLLGWIISDGNIREDRFTIEINNKDIKCLELLKNIICSEISIKSKKGRDTSYFTVSSSEISKDLCKLMSISPGKKSDSVKFPESIPSEFYLDCIRGIFDGDGTIGNPRLQQTSPQANITSNSDDLRESIKNIIGLPCNVSKNRITYSANNVLDFLDKIYADTDNNRLRLERKYERFLEWSCYVPAIRDFNCSKKLSNLKVVKCDKNAVLPSKVRASDVGYDLTIIKEEKRWGNVILYDTGIKARPDYGWYIDIVPRSSISKTGYIMVNSVGVIDRSYTGTIKIALTKIDLEADDIQLPIRIAQMIPRPIAHFEIQEVEQFEETERSDKGFGSSGQ